MPHLEVERVHRHHVAEAPRDAAQLDVGLVPATWQVEVPLGDGRHVTPCERARRAARPLSASQRSSR